MLAASWLVGCGGGSPAPLSSENSGAIVAQPDVSIGSDVFIGESNFSGLASSVKITGVFWGRLVSVADETGDIRLRDFVISNSIRDQTPYVASDGTALIYGMTRNAVTDATVVTIPAALGSTAFSDALKNLEANLTPVFDKGLAADVIGPFSMVPRNSSMVIRFDDLLEPRFDNGLWRDQSNGDVVSPQTGQLNKDLVKLRTGYPPVDPFETRIIVDPNHGNLFDSDNDGVMEFHPTRVIVSSTVSTIDSQVSNPPLAINAVGLPASIVLNSANMALRIPTMTNPSVGQTQILRNASGHALSFSSNGSTDSSTGTPDVVRALRSGGSLTQDANNGFLLDEAPPTVLGDLEVLVDGSPPPFVIDPQRPERYRIPMMAFSVLDCATTPKVGDVLVQSELRASVVDAGTANGPIISDMIVDVIAPIGGIMLPGTARLQTPFVPGIDNPPCFISFSPNPAAAPNGGIKGNAKVVFRFSEPMDPDTIRPFDSFTITRTAGEPTPYDYVVGTVVAAADLRSFSFEHQDVPFRHTQGAAETYFVNLASGVDGPTDLAGNPLAFALPQSSFSLLTNEPSSVNWGFAMRFHTADEFNDDSQFELRNGQLLYDPINERILPRPVSRFDVAADRNQPVPSVMTQFVGGIQTPLSKLGSKLQTLWRYVDVGFSLTDETNINMDVEGLSWAPVGGSVVTDSYEEFGIILSHSEWLPDEILDPNSGFPVWPSSGLKNNYANNRNDATNDPGVQVHPKELGYIVNPSDLYTASSGTAMIPYPMNQTIPLEQYRYYTWRDTALTALGGGSNGGAVLDQEILVVYGGNGPPKTYASGEIPTVGLPLLMEFRCYPSDEALGLNALDISLAANSSARPNFRAFSTGGYDNNNNPNFINPDTEETANGGFNPNSNPPGNSTPGTDNSFYIGELALVTRVSRIHTVWFDTTFPQANFVQPVIEPKSSVQPAGTSVVLAYRGATAISNLDNDDITNNAMNLDFYGDNNTDVTNSAPTFLGAGNWVNDITQINSARYFQVRISFLSNAATNQTAELQSLAFAFFDATAN